MIFFVALPEHLIEDLVLATQFLPPSGHVTPTSWDHPFTNEEVGRNPLHLLREKTILRDVQTQSAPHGQPILACSLPIGENFVPNVTPRFTQQPAWLPVMRTSIPNSSHSKANVVPNSPLYPPPQFLAHRCGSITFR